MCVLCTCTCVCVCVCVGSEDKLIDALSILKERAENDEAQSLFSLCNDLSKVQPIVCINYVTDQLIIVCLYWLTFPLKL